MFFVVFFPKGCPLEYSLYLSFSGILISLKIEASLLLPSMNPLLESERNCLEPLFYIIQGPINYSSDLIGMILELNILKNFN